MMNNTKTPVIDKKVLLPFILVTSLFALWGFANAVTDPMVQAFKKVLELSNSEAAWVQMAFYGGYFCMALPAAMFMRKYSYKVGILIGLALYATGALLFYPAAQSESFLFFKSDNAAVNSIIHGVHKRQGEEKSNEEKENSGAQRQQQQLLHRI